MTAHPTAASGTLRYCEDCSYIATDIGAFASSAVFRRSEPARESSDARLTRAAPTRGSCFRISAMNGANDAGALLDLDFSICDDVMDQDMFGAEGTDQTGDLAAVDFVPLAGPQQAVPLAAAPADAPEGRSPLTFALASGAACRSGHLSAASPRCVIKAPAQPCAVACAAAQVLAPPALPAVPAPLPAAGQALSDKEAQVMLKLQARDAFV